VRYRGVKYRSRLDAKWAAVFHHLNWEVVYDPHADGTISFLIRDPEWLYGQFVRVIPGLADSVGTAGLEQGHQ
jgi:hypothetical protein